MELTVLASSSKGNCIYLQDTAGNLLLDCGLPWKQIRQALNFQTSALAGILVTHCHNDHSAGVKDAMKAGIDCWMSRETADALQVFGHRVRIVNLMQHHRIGHWTVLGFDTVHDCPGSLGFVLANKESRLLYLTDSAYCQYVFLGLTHILIEANHTRDILDANIEAGIVPDGMRHRLIRNHMSLEVCKEFLRANDLSQVREIYLLHLSDNNSDADRFKREIQMLTGKQVYVADS